MLPRKHTTGDLMQLVSPVVPMFRNAADQAFLPPSFEYRNPMTIGLSCGLIENALGYFQQTHGHGFMACNFKSREHTLYVQGYLHDLPLHAANFYSYTNGST